MQVLKDVRCPMCTKMLCKIEENVQLQGIHFWCNRCQKEIEIKVEKNKDRAQKPMI